MPLKSEAAQREYDRIYKRMKRAGIPGTPITLEKDINNVGAMYERIIKLEKQIEELHTLLKQEQQKVDLINKQE